MLSKSAQGRPKGGQRAPRSAPSVPRVPPRTPWGGKKAPRRALKYAWTTKREPKSSTFRCRRGKKRFCENRCISSVKLMILRVRSSQNRAEITSKRPSRPTLTTLVSKSGSASRLGAPEVRFGGPRPPPERPQGGPRGPQGPPSAPLRFDSVGARRHSTWGFEHMEG